MVLIAKKLLLSKLSSINGGYSEWKKIGETVEEVALRPHTRNLPTHGLEVVRKKF